jgi:hypothetical protein
MSTSAQIAANQANAQRSTGPVTAEGKAASASNNQKHGLTMMGCRFMVHPTELEEEFERLIANLHAEHQPVGETEILLVDRLAQHEWQRRRAMRLQADCFENIRGHVEEPKFFTLYLRYQTTHERAFTKCLNDLLKLRSEKRKQEIGFASQKCREAEESRRKDKHQMTQKRHEVAVMTAEADLDFQLMNNVVKYCSEIHKDPAQDARFREVLRRYGFESAA